MINKLNIKKMGKHNSNCNKVLKVYKDLTKKGFVVEKVKNGTKIIHLKTKQFYIFHYSDKGYHPLRRWVKNNFNMDI